MITDNSEKRNARYANMRAIKDYGMGILYLAVALFMFYPAVIGFESDALDPVLRYSFGSICLIYGSWRIYRGYKKEYFKE